MDFGVMKSEMKCKKCGEIMKLVEKKKKFVFRCEKWKCNDREESCRKGSVFFGSKLQCRKIMKISRSWLQGERRIAAAKSAKVNKETVSTWYRCFVLWLLVHCVRSEKIGGPGIIVEVDETKLGKIKFNRGHRVEGVWVVCGIERTLERRIFCVQVESRDGETLCGVISRCVEEGSIVFTDKWKGYINIAERCNVEHHTVNHSKTFKDPVTGVCTNTVEGLNSAIKAAVPPRHRTENEVGSSLATFIWRRENKENLCGAFIDLLKKCLENFD